MSKEVDERVVSLEFNNQNFEKNVSQSMRTIDSLNNKLNIPGASKGLESVSKAASNIDLTSLSNSVSALEYRFSTMGIVGATAISNITTKLMQFSSKTLNFLTNGIVQGGIARAMKVETARFQLNGLLKDTAAVEAVMKDVKASVDGTAYSMDAAASVASQLAASGMRAGDDMLNSLKAVTGVAAMTNSSYEDIGRIFTQVSGQGRLMGDQLLQFSARGLNVASTLADYLTKVGDGAKVTEAQVRDMVSKGKIDFNTFSKAMSDAFSESAFKANETVNGTFSNIKAALAKIGESFVAPLVKSNGPLVNLLNALREKVNIVKDKLVGKDGIEGPLTKAGNKAGEFINKVAGIIKGDGVSFTNSAWDQLSNKITEAGVPLETFQNKFKQVAKAHNIDVEKMIEETGSFGSALTKIKKPGKLVVETLKELSKNYQQTGIDQQKLQEKLSYLQKMVDETWRGDWGNQPVRQKLMEQAGHNYQEIQELVNKTVDKHRLTQADLNEETLKSLGYTKKQIDLLGELAKEAEKSGTSMNELLDSLNKPSKSFLIFDTFSNVVKGVKTVIKSFKAALEDAFTPLDKNSFTSVLVFLHDLSEHFVISDKNAEKLTRTFKGLFAAIDLIGLVFRNTFGAAFQLASKVVLAVADALGITCDSLLDFTAVVGDGIIALRDWCKEHDAIGKAISGLANIIADVIVKVIDFVKAIWQIPAVQNTVKGFFTWLNDSLKKAKEFFDKIVEPIEKFVDHLKELADTDKLNWESISKSFSMMMDEIARSFGQKDWNSVGQNIAAGISQGIKTYANNAINTAVEMAQHLFESVCNFLGIHSPSRLFKWIGENCIKGLVEGLKIGFGSIEELCLAIKKVVMEVLGDLDFNDILLTGTLLTTLSFANRIVKVMESVVAPAKSFAKMMDGVSNILNAVASSKKAAQFKMRADAILVLAGALAVLAGSLYLISKIDPDRLWPAVGAITVLMLLLGGITAATALVPDTKGVWKLSSLLISFGVCIGLIASAVKKVGKLDPKSAKLAITGVGILVGEMGLILLAVAGLSRFYNDDGIQKTSKMLLAFSVCIRIIAGAIKQLALLDSTSLGNAVGSITWFMILLTGFAAVIAYINGKDHKLTESDQAGNTLLKMAAAIAIFTAVIKVIAGMSLGDITKGIVTLAVLEVLIGAFIALNAFVTSKMGGASFIDPSSSLLKMATGIILMIGAIKMIAKIPGSDITKALSVITQIELFFLAYVGAVAFFSYKSGVFNDPSSSLLKMSAAMVILAFVIRFIASMSNSEVDRGIKFIQRCLILFGYVVALSKFAGEHGDKAGTMLLKMAGAMAILVLVMRLIRGLSDEDIERGMTFIKGCMRIFEEIVAISFFAGKNADKAGEMLAKMAIPMAVLAASIAVLSFLDQDQLRKASESLSIVIAAFSLLTASVSKIDKGAMAPLIVLSVMIAEIAAILYVFSALDIQNALPNAIALGVLLAAISASLVLVSKADGVTSGALKGLAAMGVAVVLVGTILGVMDHFNVKASITTATAISELLLAMSVCVAILSKFGPTDLKTGLTSLATLGALIVGVGALCAALGALITYIPQVEEFLDKGIPVLSKIGTAIGEFIGNIFEGLFSNSGGEEPKSLMDKFGEFIQSMGDLFNNVKEVDSSKIDNIKKMCTAMLAISGTGVLTSLLNFFGSGDGLDKLGEQLPKFGTALKKFSDSLTADGGIDEGALNAASKAMTALSKLNNSLLAEGGLISKITGTKNLEDFGKQLKKFGESLVKFSSTVKGRIDQGAIETACAAGNSLASLEKSLYGSDGVIQGFLGKKSLGTFGDNLTSFGKALVKFSAAVSKDGAINQDAIATAVAAAQSISELEGNLESVGGLISLFTGYSDLGTFSVNLTAFGKALTDFSASVSGKEFNVEAVTAAVTAAKGLAEIQNALPTGAGLISGITGGYATSLVDFGIQLSLFGPNFATFCNSVTGLDVSNLPAIGDGLKAIAKAMTEMNGISSGSVGEFTKAVNSLATTNLKGLINAFDGIDTEKLSGIGKKMSDGLVSGINSGTDSVTKAMSNLASAAAKAAGTKGTEFHNAGYKMAGKFNGGIGKKNTFAKTRGEELAQSAANGAGGSAAVANFASAGSACAEGFASGITDGSSSAISAAVDMALAAYKAAKNALDVNSPSKLFRRMAICVPEGFAQGIVRGTKYVIAASRKMANTSIDTTKNALNKIASLNLDSINTDPTIRPVVDLSNVSAGADKIASMLNLNPSVGLAANLGAINSAMNSRNQNDSNQDVINALRDVKRAITKSAKPTYNINGITYDDGSNVSNAVSDLVRAVKIEGRV